LAGAGGPAQPSPQPFVRGEKQWMDNAQNIGNWGENQMEIANARIPYQSTAQIESSAAPNKFGLAELEAQLNHPLNLLSEVRSNGWIMLRILVTGVKTKWRLLMLEFLTGPPFNSNPKLLQISMD